jgi:beta-phosphoglucomutase-like phosphatase (HAD superfamily)
VVGFNGGICDLMSRVSQLVAQEMYWYMFHRGERFNAFEFLSETYEMFGLAVERGHGEAASGILHAAERSVAASTTATAGIADLLTACRVTDRPAVVYGGAATDIIEDYLVGQGLRHLVTAVVGRDGGRVPDLAAAVVSVGAEPGSCAFVSDSEDAVRFARHSAGLLPIGIEGGRSRRKHLAIYGPVVRNLTKLADAVRAVPRLPHPLPS